jgi:tRNA (guanine6-N2)-methyltransferase
VAGAEPEALVRCRIAEDLFVVLASGPGITAAAIETLVARSPHLDFALAAHDRLRGGRGVRSAATYRVIVRSQVDLDQRRSDIADGVTRVLGRRLGRHWRAVPDGGHVEVWVTVLSDCAIVALRLTGAAQRQGGKIAHLPGSLRPAVAAAMVRLSAPRPEDRVLDPFCGAGTLLIERDAAGPHGLMIGSDISAEALAAAEANIGPRHKPLELHRWDATHLPLEDASVDAVITNPPFGAKVVAADPAGLTRLFAGEAARVLTPGGRLVALCADPRPLVATLDEGWTGVRRHGVTTQGRRVTMVKAIRT